MADPNPPTRTDLVAPGHDPGKEDRAGHGIPIVPSMDGFRAFAICGIVLLHLIASTGMSTDRTFRIGVYGVLPSMVEVLFILSGFVVFLPTVVHGEFGSVRPFAIRRAARLLPAYWVAVTVTLLILVTLPTGSGPAFPGGLDLLSTYSVLTTPAQLIRPELLLGFGINGVLWTLSIEITFYLLLPLIAMPFLRRPLVGILCSIAIVVLWKIGSAHVPQLYDLLGSRPGAARANSLRSAADLQFPAFAFQFALGMTGAILFVRLRESGAATLTAAKAALVQGGALAVCLLCAYLFGRYAVGDFAARGDAFLGRRQVPLELIFSIAITTFMVATALAPPKLQVPFSLPRVRWLGDVSYGVFLIHIPMWILISSVLSRIGVFDDLGRLATFALLAIPASILYGFLSARLIEQPIRRWAQRFGRRSAPAAGLEHRSAGRGDPR